MQKPRKFYPPVKKPNKPLTAAELFSVLLSWDGGLEECSEMNLIACGSTALALMDLKPLKEEVELLVPEKKEYGLLILYLKAEKYRKVSNTGWQKAGQPFTFNLHSGNKIYAAELLHSPLQNSGNRKLQQWKKIYLGVLNPLDLIITKLFRGTEADLQDCRLILKHENINVVQLKKRCKDTAAFDVRENQVVKNLEKLLAPFA